MKAKTIPETESNLRESDWHGQEHYSLLHYTDDDERLIRILFEIRSLLSACGAAPGPCQAWTRSQAESKLARLVNMYHVINLKLNPLSNL